MSLDEYYQSFPLPPLPTSTQRYQKYQKSKIHYDLEQTITEVEVIAIQEKLKTAMDKIVQDWTERHDSLVDALNASERIKRDLVEKYNNQLQKYQKAAKEMHFYRTSYDQLLLRRHSLLSSSCNSGSGRSLKKGYCSPPRSTSSFSTALTPVNEVVEAALSRDQLKDKEIHSMNFDSDLSDIINHSFTISECDESLQSQDDKHTESSRIKEYTKEKDTMTGNNEENGEKEIHSRNSENNNTNNNNNNNNNININNNTRSLDPVEETKVLKFACGDSFWNTIANGKANKEEVVQTVMNYLRRGGNPNVAKNSDTAKKVKEGYSLVHALIAIKNTAALQSVLLAGAKPNVFPLTDDPKDKVTPLVLAAQLGYLNGVRLLIEQAGVDITNSYGPSGENALHAAVQSNSKSVVAYLLKASQNILLRKLDTAGATPLHYACSAGKSKFVILLVKEYDAKMDAQDSKGETPLHYAIRHRQLQVVTTLIRLGADPNVCILKKTPTPLDLAKSKGYKLVVDYLKQVGGKTTKEIEKKRISVVSSNTSTFSSESYGSNDTNSSSSGSIKKFFHVKTTKLLNGK
ncbi:hypothetical protein CU097_004319 [Rhizopus azygosporus]|uniref:protein S-acyltransferase n=1 Tax=Rhizopus azygosporus TaxID=86630 RepID=A0A367IZJ3_RHIAZ|nr:hypothetical protein CU097_004319 [Rhizopus azygosporus]